MSTSISVRDNTDFQLIEGAFPHIGTKLALLWGHPEFHSFVQRLEQDTRQGSRAGFPADILFAMARLVLAHDAAFPGQAPSGPSIWGESNFR
jgi:hypothetical protein